ncbi:MAG: hypothetical protein WBP64_13915 [Nitrososphaeraceae archaeon]
MDRSALGFIILLGIVSLFADMTYEGARSVTGPYLAILGASATIELLEDLGNLLVMVYVLYLDPWPIVLENIGQLLYWVIS